MISNDRHLPESGPIVVGDAPGVFIRGDNALTYAWWLDNLMQRRDLQDRAPVSLAMLEGLRNLLRTSVDHRRK